MRSIRFSIGGLMGFVVLTALGIGGLKNANEAWASGCFTLTIVGLVLAILHAVRGRGRDRAYWLGFVVAGWIYLAVAFGLIGSTRVISPPLLVELLFDQLEPMFHPTGITALVTFTPTLATPPTPASTVATGAPTPPPVTATLTAATTTRRFLTMPPTNMVRVHYSQVAHSLTALLAGMLGGLYSAWLFARRDRRVPGHEAEVSPSSP